MPEDHGLREAGFNILPVANLLENKLGPRGRKALTGALLGHSTYKAAKALWGYLEQKKEFVIAVPASDNIYPDLNNWLIENIAPKDRKSVLVQTRRVSAGEEWESSSKGFSPNDDDSDQTIAKLDLFYDGDTAQVLYLGGHKVTVYTKRVEWTPLNPRQQDRDRMEFVVKTQAGREAVIDFLKSVADRQIKSKPQFLSATKWGGWHRKRAVAQRDLSTVILRDGQIERLVADMREFVEAEQAYAHFGQPWHRGYLLEGPPGTGKTSIAAALATELGLDVYYMVLSIIDNDGNLAESLASVKPRSLLIIEDIDIVHAAKTRDDSESAGVTLAGLLNGLDGFVTPHGLITIMTTNNVDILDPALIRPGRVDMREHIGYLNQDQFERLVYKFMSYKTAIKILPDAEVTPAEVVSVLKNHLGKPEFEVEFALATSIRGASVPFEEEG